MFYLLNIELEIYIDYTKIAVVAQIVNTQAKKW
jgi:hypothetical protein